MQFMVDRYSANYFSFADDCFGADPQWLDKFISSVNARFHSQEVMYGCNMRVDYLDEKTLGRLRETGLTRIFHGIESGSPRMWSILGKNLKPEVTPEWIVKTIQKEVELGIDAQCSIMVGLPEETEEDIDETLTLCRRLADVGAHFAIHLLNPYEGTRILDLYPDLVKPFDIYEELGDIDNFDADFRRVFGDSLTDLSSRLPDFKWVQPSTPYEVFRGKYLELRRITSYGLPFFYRGPGV